MTRRTFCAATVLAGAGMGRAAEVGLDSDGMLLIGRRRRFITGLYQLPKIAEPWREASEAGFDLVHVNAGSELDTARQHGLYGWITVGAIAPPTRHQDEQRIRETVIRFRDDPSLLFWETVDEPTFEWKKPGPRVPASHVIAAYRLIKSLDPKRPVFLNHSPTHLVTTLREYNAGADIISTDIYPVIPRGIRELYGLWPDGLHGDLLNSYISQVGQYADKMRQVAGPSRAVFMVLQAFAWENLREKDRDPAMVRYPERRELSFMVWQSIVHGVNGLLFWGLGYTPPDAPLWPDLKSVSRQLHFLGDELAAPPVSLDLALEYHDTGHSLDRGIEWIAKPGREATLLVAVNADRNPVEVTFSGLAGFRACQALFETPPASLRGGRFRARFKPFEAHLYRLAP